MSILSKQSGPAVGFGWAAVGFNFGEYPFCDVPLQQTKNCSDMKEEIYYVVDSLGVSHPETYETPGWSITTFFVEGGLGFMIIISLFLIALLVAAWKAPRWVKEIGLGALVVSIFSTMLGLMQMLQAIQIAGDISPAVLAGGFKVTMITTFYGLIVYFISLVIRIIQKPRI